MGIHESLGKSDEWYTPPYIFQALKAKFDLDVASPGPRTVPWIPARYHMMLDSLEREWKGFIWMNPPYGCRNGIKPWVKKFIEHGNGIALVPDRTSAPWWQFTAHNVEGILFVSPKIKFLNEKGIPGKSPANGSCLVGIGKKAISALGRASSLGILTYPTKF